MRTNKSAILIVTLVTLILSMGRMGHSTTLTFDSLVRGSVFTNQLQSSGILVSGISPSGCCPPGKVLNVAAGDLGVFPFGGSLSQAILYGIVGDQVNFDFVLPDGSQGVTNFASIRVGDGDPVPESIRVSFFDVTGFLLNAQEVTTGTGPVNGGATVSFSGSGISRLEILGIGMGSGGAVDDLTFNLIESFSPSPAPVPEPSTMILLASGLIGLVGYNYKRGKKTV